MPERFTAFYSKICADVCRATGRPSALLLALATVVVWAATGPLFRFSDTWQLVINTGTTIVTFLMVFLIQNSASRDNTAIHAKLDELILVNKKARNDLIQVERTSTEDEIAELRGQMAD